MKISREERARRLRARAAKARSESSQAFRISRELGQCIPFGQPILVGHHSEGRHRRLIERMQAGCHKGLLLSEKADELERRARAAEMNSTIYGDEPDAIDLLRTKIVNAEKNHEIMKAANKLIVIGDLDGLAALVGKDTAEELTQPGRFGGMGYASFKLTNNRANINRMRDRLAQLESVKATPASTEEFDDFSIVRDPDAYRIKIIFPGKPDETTRSRLKSLGFRWAPSEGAWQRHLNSAGEFAVRIFVSERRK